MVARWYYEASEKWLLSRKLVLTATEVVALLPELKRVRKSGLKKLPDELGGGEFSLACAGIWAEKTSTRKPDLYAPSNEAARGHVLEPYAVLEFNRASGSDMKHWDDCIICSKDGLGFSPDALDIECNKYAEEGFFPVEGIEQGFFGKPAKRMLEVKCYSEKHHTEMLLEPKEEHKERYQVAVGMTVLPTIEVGAIVFYNPNARIQMIVNTYKQEELESEIKDVKEILGMYNKTAETLENCTGWYPAQFTEDQIYKEHLESLQDSMRIGDYEPGTFDTTNK